MRKSKDQRIADIKTTISKYEAAGLGSDRSVNFLRDMCYRLEGGKYLTTKQRVWADKLCSAELPKIKNEARVKEILAASAVDGMQQLESTLKDFAFKVGKGWNLSEKQEKFLQSMLQKAEHLRANGRFRPAPEIMGKLQAAVDLCSRKNDWYWQHRPGTAKAFSKVERWLDWNKASNSAKAAQVDFFGEEPIIDEWACDKLLGSVKKQLSELDNPKYPEGSMAWRVMHRAPNALTLITGRPAVRNGDVIYPCLIDGEMTEVPTGQLRKRRG